MTIQSYILKNKKIVPVDLTTWVKWKETADRHIGNNYIGKIHVSTVFLGIDHNFGVGKPSFFETMIFGGEYDEYQERYSTYEEAEKGHNKALKMVKGKDYMKNKQQFNSYEKVLKRTFICPFCNEEVERINEHLLKEPIKKQLEIGLLNKRYHFMEHREERRKAEKIARLRKIRTAL